MMFFQKTLICSRKCISAYKPKVLVIIKYEKPKASKLNKLLNDQALQYLVELNSVSSQCARGKSSLARKTEVHPKFFQW